MLLLLEEAEAAAAAVPMPSESPESRRWPELLRLLLPLLLLQPLPRPSLRQSLPPPRPRRFPPCAAAIKRESSGEREMEKREETLQSIK